MPQASIDQWRFFGTLAVILFVCAPLALSPETAVQVLVDIKNFISLELGWVYLVGTLAAMGVLAWLAFGRYGSTVLGESKTPEFSNISWMAMLFCAGIGAGLVYWCMIEWAYYIQSPPFGAEPGSLEAQQWASTYGLFHWGFSAWAIYCLPALAIAYPYYKRKSPSLRFSLSIYSFTKDETHPMARFVDFLFMIALVGGSATSLGLSTPMIAALISRLTGAETGIELNMFVVVLTVVLFMTSVWFGLKKGIKMLSNVNLGIAVGILIFVLAVGPTADLIKGAVNSMGIMVDNFWRMSLYTDPYTDSGFVESWTVFYWAWWIAYAPFVGLFVTRISRGRTFREVIVGMLGLGTLGAGVFFMIMGNYAQWVDTTGVAPIAEIVNTDGGPAGIVATLDTLPYAGIVILLFCILSLIFAATTYDSASYILAAGATMHLPEGVEPARWHRVFWAVAIAIMPVTLIFEGNPDILTTVLLLVAFPLVFVGIAMTMSLLRLLKEDDLAAQAALAAAQGVDAREAATNFEDDKKQSQLATAEG